MLWLWNASLNHATTVELEGCARRRSYNKILQFDGALTSTYPAKNLTPERTSERNERQDDCAITVMGVCDNRDINFYSEMLVARKRRGGQGRGVTTSIIDSSLRWHEFVDEDQIGDCHCPLGRKSEKKTYQ